jgi:hypothetical protein
MTTLGYQSIYVHYVLPPAGTSLLMMWYGSGTGVGGTATGATYAGSINDLNLFPGAVEVWMQKIVNSSGGGVWQAIGYKNPTDATISGQVGLFSLFNKNSALTDYWESAASTYTSTSGGSPASSSTRLASNIPDGSWVALKLPYKICLKNYEFIGPGTKSPKEGQIWGSTDGTTWSHVHTFTGGVTDVKNNETVSGNTKYYSEYAFITTKITGADTVVHISQWRVFGTREQGQSVLHDGQLTLTKNLNVPRIGPALDADDTPRRDRLVVEYNTSTNPTFEGAVRDTSGRGNDGVFYGNSSYSVGEKAFVFTGDDTGRIEGRASGAKGEWLHSSSLWFKFDVIEQKYLYIVGNQTSPAGVIGCLLLSSKISFTIFGKEVNSTTVIKPGIWYHLASVYRGGIFNATNFEIYLNGVREAISSVNNSGNASIDLTGEQLLVGSTGGTNEFNGSISQFKLYDTTLAADEVKTLYDMGRTGSVANPQPLHIAAPLYVRGDIHGGCPVYFYARNTSNFSGASGGATIPYNSVFISRGGAPDSDGVFTCPLAGVYKFDFYARNETTTGAYLRAYLNGVYTTAVGDAYMHSNRQYQQTNGIYVSRLNVGDRIQIKLHPNTSVTIGGYYNAFNGQYLSSL